jgi:hypothetical protein
VPGLRFLICPQADVHRLLVQGSFLAQSPAQVDGLKTGSMLRGQIAQAREDALLQSITLCFQVAECGADENPECATRLNHSIFSLHANKG